MLNHKKMNKAMEKVFFDIDSDKTLVPKAREMNKALSNIIAFGKATAEYQKMSNSKKPIKLFE